MLYSLLNSTQKQLHGHKSNKMRESTLPKIGNFEEKIDLSRIYLVVSVLPSDLIVSKVRQNCFLSLQCSFLLLWPNNHFCPTIQGSQHVVEGVIDLLFDFPWHFLLVFQFDKKVHFFLALVSLIHCLIQCVKCGKRA